MYMCCFVLWMYTLSSVLLLLLLEILLLLLMRVYFSDVTFDRI